MSVRVGSYELTEDPAGTYITLRNVQSSREWIGLAVEQYVAGRRFKIPDNLRGIL